MARILQLVTRLAVRGVPRHVLDLSEGLRHRGHQVEIVAGQSEPGEGELWEEARQRGIPTTFLPALRRPLSPAADAAAFAGLWRHLARTRPQLVHTHISKAGVLGRLAARLAGVPVVLHTYHGQVEEVEGRGPQGRLLRAAEALAASCSDALIAVSADTAAGLQALGVGRAGQYRLIRNGIDLERFAPQATPPAPVTGSPLLGSVASLTPEKGLELLIAALPSLAAMHPLLRLCIVGEGPLRPALEAQIRALGLEGRVDLAGNTPDVRPYLRAFDLVVTPSRREGQGRVLMEALALGRPVLAARVGGIPELIEHGQQGWLVPPEDPEALGQGAAHLLANPGLCAALAQRGRQRALREFGLDTMIAQVEALYAELLGRAGAR
ncbi:MAG: glycosyltransferase family 4 protein [Candidatus Handelsmanbacteria bacterium]|nr:glycosyltransferase family 4 protein [Candidatus Handelsmanbacteria bacterium]